MSLAMKNITLTRGYAALVDDDDFERVSRHCWSAVLDKKKTGEVRTVYARTCVVVDGKDTCVLLHRFLLGVTERRVQVDHRDHNGLNNQRYNLRKASSHQNGGNRRIGSNNKSGCKGVHWNEECKKWMVNVRVNGKKKYLGLYKSLPEAVQVYKNHALETYGEFANI